MSVGTILSVCIYTYLHLKILIMYTKSLLDYLLLLVDMLSIIEIKMLLILANFLEKSIF